MNNISIPLKSINSPDESNESNSPNNTNNRNDYIRSTNIHSYNQSPPPSSGYSVPNTQNSPQDSRIVPYNQSIQSNNQVQNSYSPIELNDRTNISNPPMPPNPPTRTPSVHCGGKHTCMLINTPQPMLCFGSNKHGQVDIPDSLTILEIAVVAASAGYKHTCAIDDYGILHCWGCNNRGQTNIPSRLKYLAKEVSASDYHTCGISAVGRLYCWGRDIAGESNVNARDYDTDVSMVTTGYNYTCYVVRDMVKCIGGNNYGQLLVPYQFGFGNSNLLDKYKNKTSKKYLVQDLDAGYYHTCASGLKIIIESTPDSLVDLNQVNVIDSTTNNSINQMSNSMHEMNINQHTPPAPNPDSKPKSNSDYIMKCWGLNSNKQCSIPKEMEMGVDMVGTGSMHTCAMKVDGTIACWGHKGFGQTELPQRVYGQHILDLSVGDWHGCVVLGDHNLECWGNNQWNQSQPDFGYA